MIVSEFALDAISILLLMVFYNLAINRVIAAKWHLLFALSMSAVVILWGIDNNLTWQAMGFANPLGGLLYGGAAAILLNFFLAGLATNKTTREFFVDTRVIGISPRRALKKTLIDIPLRTVVFEEVLFRGVLLGFLLTRYDSFEAIVASAVLFGLWHIWPAMDFARSNKSASGFPIATIFGTVVFTFASGVVFAWLRVESGSLLAPIMIHVASNSGSFAASWFTNNGRRSKHDGSS